ncbi:MAG: ATP phosphoribosyltransferase regulatory subunit [Actinomycetota bacterium]
MIHPIPSGTRDVLPDEMRELRAIGERVRTVFDAAGYGEVYTPALEYESTLVPSAPPPAYRLFDDQGEVLVLRSDMTVPIARIVGTRYLDADPPLRFCYLAHAYRGVRPQRGQSREFLQAGVELIGPPGAIGTAEALTVLCAALDAAGLAEYRIGIGDASIYPALLDGFGVPSEARAPLLQELVTRDFVGLQREVDALGISQEAASALLRIPQIRGGREILDGEVGAAGKALEGLRELYDQLSPDVAGRLIFDLGLLRSLGYYTGALFEVYDPMLGVPIGGGGRYDDLLGHYGRSLAAVGFALNIERLHIALMGEERGGQR